MVNKVVTDVKEIARVLWPGHWQIGFGGTWDEICVCTGGGGWAMACVPCGPK